MGTITLSSLPPYSFWWLDIKPATVYIGIFQLLQNLRLSKILLAINNSSAESKIPSGPDSLAGDYEECGQSVISDFYCLEQKWTWRFCVLVLPHWAPWNDRSAVSVLLFINCTGLPLPHCLSMGEKNKIQPWARWTACVHKWAPFNNAQGDLENKPVLSLSYIQWPLKDKYCFIKVQHLLEWLLEASGERECL